MKICVRSLASHGLSLTQWLVCLLLCLGPKAMAQKSFPLYSGTIPNATSLKTREIPVKYGNGIIGYRNIATPSLTIYQPSPVPADGSAVIICPGGGYLFENEVYEGKSMAEALARHGITAFVLRYRLPSDSILVDKSIGPLQDAQQAIRVVRQRAKEWGVNPAKIGIMGFSAGGHVASTAATHFNTSYIPNPEGTSLRPDFSVLVYPVISFQEGLAHRPSRAYLLGRTPSEKQKALFSNELQVTAQTPPAWLTHTGDDTVVVVGNSVKYYEALIRNKVPAEMHLYPKGGHGFVLYQPADVWMQPLLTWMRKNKWAN